MKENLIKTRTFNFSLQIVGVYKERIAEKEFVLSKQLLRSATSIGANVVEAEAAQSKADFISKMSIASKEARETGYWLHLLKESNITGVDLESSLLAVEEIIKIITSIVKSSKESLNNSTSKIQNSKL